MVNRINRGFSRLGVLAAVLVVLCGVLAMIVRWQDGPPTVGDALFVGGLTSLLALAAWICLWGIGWVLAGFAKD